MALSLDGLVSGLDTTALIDALMDVHAIPRTLLKAKADDKGLIISQLQTLNSSLQDLATRAKAAADGSALAGMRATSSSDAVAVTARPEASPLTTDIVVDRVATRHSVVTAAFAQRPEAPAVLTIENAAGELTEISAASGSAADIARAVNGAGLGISAMVVSAGTDAAGAPLQRLQFTSADTGQDAAFRIHRGDAASVAAGTAVDLAAEPGGAVITTGADARIRLWAGTAAEQVVTSSTNTFTDLFAGVDVTIARASADPVTVGVDTDVEGRTKATADFVSQLAGLLTRIDNGSKATVADGQGTATTLGVFTGDSTVRALRQALAGAVQHPVGGTSPSSIGISLDRHGALSFDEETFTAALAKDPDAVQSLVSAIAARVQETAETYSDRYDGLLTARILGQESEVRSLGEQIERWDVRLEQRRATLERTYARLETMLSQMQSQSDYLTSQLASLSPSKQGA
ncbi:flagellar filament capping protein FliD [Microbacterium sp. CIAB417]|uniref:flagellar filament capping protein FliD n=1 Tax=Microbacterium sp. CIAB417 TaxID=2860287 RepID=UPI001FAC069C|nr:flagellar filament capping protein FliD [Microbacterium sp. CIAB417]